MRDSLHSVDRGAVSFPSPFIGPRTWTLLTGCAVVSTGYALGAAWLGRGLLGVPLGLWLVGGATLVAHRLSGKKTWTAADVWIGPSAMTHTPEAVNGASGVSVARLPGEVIEVAGAATRGVTAAWKAVTQVHRELTSAADRISGQSERVRILLDLPDEEARAIEQAALRATVSGVDVRFVREVGECECDAVVRRDKVAYGDGYELRVEIAESPDRPAAWKDWGEALPMGYAGVFTPRVDFSGVTLTDLNLDEADQALAAVRLILAGALLGRTAVRVSGGNRLTGRTPIASGSPSGGPAERALLELASSIEAFAGTRESSAPVAPPRFVRSAARGVGAWLTTYGGVGGELPACARGRLASACDALLPGEAESELRLAAVQISEMHDADGTGSLLRAARTLRRRTGPCASDPLAFIMAEAELGEPTGLTLGRIAAGVAMLWGTSPGETLAYVREDLIEDLQHAGWLADREQDLHLLRQVMSELDASLGHTPAKERGRRNAA